LAKALAAADLLDVGRGERYREALEQIAWGVLDGVEASTREAWHECQRVARAALSPEPESEG
jgi:hypothetical protein